MQKLFRNLPFKKDFFFHYIDELDEKNDRTWLMLVSNEQYKQSLKINPSFPVEGGKREGKSNR